MPLDHEDQGLRLKSQQPVMYDNLLAASAARRLSNTSSLPAHLEIDLSLN
jgi:hypothetical protein